MQINDITLDTLTLKFWRDKSGPEYKGDKKPDWACQVGENMVEGICGFGATPLEAIKSLCDRISFEEGCKTDNDKLILR